MLSPQSHQESKLDLKLDYFVKDAEHVYHMNQSTQYTFMLRDISKRAKGNFQLGLCREKNATQSPQVFCQHVFDCYLGDSAFIFSFGAL